jgi:hypothetical protein
MKGKKIDFTPYKNGISDQDRALLHFIIRQWPELRCDSQWCRYHRNEWLMQQERMKARAA